MTGPRLYLNAVGQDLATSLADDALRASLEAQLPDWLRAQRWFGGQTRQIIAAHFTGWLPLDPEDGAMLGVVRVADTEGRETHHPLFMAPGADGNLLDALTSAPTRRYLHRLLLDGVTQPGTGLTLQGELLDQTEARQRPDDGRVVGVEQSNSAIIYGDHSFLKIYRRLEAGPDPETELNGFLCLETDFQAVPRLLAVGRLRDVRGDTSDLLLLQAFVPNNGDGWLWAQQAARRALDAVDDPAVLPHWLTREATMLSRATDLGRVTAQLHTALASGTAPGLCPEPVTASDLTDWIALLHDEAARTAQAITRGGYADPATIAAVGAAQQSTMMNLTAAGLKTRVHGDFHLGQVLQGPDGFLIIDFEGEPARPLAERRRLQHPLVDVAGMVRSWNYAARSVSDDVTWPIAAAWERAMRNAFLDTYWRVAAEATPSFLPPAKEDRALLLRLFELTKALYELRYELDNRPGMVYIPATAVRELTARPLE